MKPGEDQLFDPQDCEDQLARLVCLDGAKGSLQQQVVAVRTIHLHVAVCFRFNGSFRCPGNPFGLNRFRRDASVPHSLNISHLMSE